MSPTASVRSSSHAGTDAPFDTLGYRADFNADGTLNDDDLGLYITLFFAGCE